MWINAFHLLRNQTHTLEGRLLAGRVAFRGSANGAADDDIANADAVLALLALKATPPVELALVHPEATPIKARQTLLALAFAELEHYLHHTYQSGSAGLLFVTQQIVDAREHFKSVRVRSVRISDVFNILSLPATPAQHWKNLLIANPGRALRGGSTLRGLRAMVIDASHPRTLQHLSALLAHPDLRQIPVRIVIAPFHATLLEGRECRMIWLWDPPTATEVHRLLSPNATFIPSWASRKYWFTASCMLDEKFAEVERLLSEATRLGGAMMPPEMIEAWGVLASARSLTVPLEQAERAWHNARFGKRLKDRIEALRRSTPTADGNLRHFLAMQWTNIINALDAAYDVLATIEASPKFFTLIDALEQFSKQQDHPIRIVTPSESEAPLLASLLTDIDQDLAAAVNCGAIEVVPQREEARRVAEGNVRTTVLMGGRSGRYRHLDLFTSHEVNVVTYPSEGIRDRHRIERLYHHWKSIANEHRDRIAAHLKLNASSGPTRVSWRSPTIEIHSSDASLPTSKSIELPEASPGFAWTAVDEIPTESFVKFTATTVQSEFDKVVIEDVEGDQLTFPVGSYVDVYRPHTDKLMHAPVHSLVAGDFLVILLDDEFESLFHRMCEIGNRRRPALNTVNLERWNIAKSRIYHRFGGSPQRIYGALQTRISVGYQALTSWFGTEHDDDGECIAPREETDFQHLATLSGVYRDEENMHATFKSIHEERVNRRKLGRQLRSALKSLVRGQQFDQALRAAEALNSDVEEVMHAIELREVTKIFTSPRNQQCQPTTTKSF